MSTAEKIKALEQYIDPAGLALFQEVSQIVARHDPDSRALAVNEALEIEDHLVDDIYIEHLQELLDQLEVSTATFVEPPIERKASFKKDLTRFFGTADHFLELGRLDGLRNLMTFYRRIFHPTEKKVCGRILSRCSNKECFAENNERYKYNGVQYVICPNCDAPRSLCSQSPMPNGRCSLAYHGGNRHTVVELNGRAGLYARAMTSELQDAYINAVTDPNFLSVAPEIGALAARSQQLMSQLGDMDYMAVQAEIRQSTRDLRNASTDDDVPSMLAASDRIISALDDVSDDNRRWNEIAALSGRLSRLAETERKRIVDAQLMVTVQEMYDLQQETLTVVRDAATIVASRLYSRINREPDIAMPQIRTLVLRAVNDVISGRVKVDDYIFDDVVSGELLESGG